MATVLVFRDAFGNAFEPKWVTRDRFGHFVWSEEPERHEPEPGCMQFRSTVPLRGSIKYITKQTALDLVGREIEQGEKARCDERMMSFEILDT